MVRTVLVTGANSEIGLETAPHLAGLGFGVVGTARFRGQGPGAGRGDGWGRRGPGHRHG